MYWLDTAILLVLGMGTVLGAMTGFLWQVARIVSLAAALAVAIFLNEWATNLIQEICQPGADPRLTQGLAYVGVFAAIYLVLYYATRLLYHAIRAVDLESIDRLLGALVGFIKVAVVLAAVSFAMSHYPSPRTKELLEKSTLAPVLSEGLQFALAAIPQEYKDDLSTGLKNLRAWAKTKGERPETEEELPE